MAPEQSREEDRDRDPDDPLTGHPGSPDQGGVGSEFVDAPMENPPGDTDTAEDAESGVPVERSGEEADRHGS